MTRSASRLNAEKMKPHWIEWLTGLVSTLLVLATIGWILYETIITEDRPPQLTAQILKTERVASGWQVMVEVSNSGDQAAAAVEVKGVLMDGSSTVEEAEATFDYVPGGSTTRGGLIFVNDPSRARLEILPTAFTEP